MASTQNIKARFRRVFHHAFIKSFLSDYQKQFIKHNLNVFSPNSCLLYTSPSPRDS